MITLAFLTLNKKVIKFTVDNRIIKYFDDFWPEGIQIMPLNVLKVRQLMLSGKENLKQMAKLIRDANSGSELEEYNRCKDDVMIAEMVRKDAKSKGLIEIK